MFEKTSVSYAELNARANAMAHTVIARRVGLEQIVALQGAVRRNPFTLVPQRLILDGAFAILAIQAIERP